MAEKISDCPICGKPLLERYQPFCSKRCADRDLGRWLIGDYRLPALGPLDSDDVEELLEAIEAEVAANDPNGGSVH